MDHYRLSARVLEAFTNNELPALVNELLALEAEEEGKVRILSTLEEEVPNIEIFHFNDTWIPPYLVACSGALVNKTPWIPNYLQALEVEEAAGI